MRGKLCAEPQVNKLAQQILQTVNELLQSKGLLPTDGTLVDATPIGAPSSTKNASGEPDPEMVSGASAQPRTTKKGNHWDFAIGARIGARTPTWASCTPSEGAAATVNDVREAGGLLHGHKSDALGTSAAKARPSIRAKVEHPLRVVKRQTGHLEVRYRWLAKNSAQLTKLDALSNLWMARGKLLVLDGHVRLKAAHAP